MAYPSHGPTTTSITTTRTATASGASGVPRAADLAERIEKLLTVDRPRYRRLWAYYRNPMRVCGTVGDVAAGGSDRPYRQAQEWGLPARITGARASDATTNTIPTDGPAARKEVVIENDIGWRVDALVDYLFGKTLTITSAAPDPVRREQIGELLRLVLAHSGGVVFLQQRALLGSIYGFVDVLVKLDPAAAALTAPDGGDATSAANAAAATTCNTRDLGTAPAACGTVPPHAEPAPPAAAPSSAPSSSPVDGDGAGGPRGEPDGAARPPEPGDHAVPTPGASHPSPTAPTHGDPGPAAAATAPVDLVRLARLVRRDRRAGAGPADLVVR